MRLDVPLMLGGLGLALALAIFVPDFRSLCPAGHEPQGLRCVPAQESAETALCPASRAE